ncbi:MAG: serine hydrolase domain-containing protein [Woeseiaceae bacterium]
MQSRIEEVLAEERLTGIAWALVGENGDVRLGATGFRDNATQSGFTTDTRFHVGSVTKSLLSTGVLRLATTGAIELDSPVARYLPDLRFDNPWRGNSQVTVRHLLDHTSGLEDARMWQMFSERAKADTPLLAAFPDSQELLRIRSRPGSRFSYSNLGYTILGLIIESVAGDRYETYLDDQLLVPLAMHDSTFAFTTQDGEDADPMLAWGHVDDGSRYVASPMFLRPAGQFTTTTGDLARFMKFLLGNGVVDGQVLVDPVLMRSRGHPSGTEAADGGLSAGYALGVGRRDRHDVVGYCHGGNVVGFVSMLCFYPDESKAFAYSVNTDSETADYGRIDSILIGAIAVTEALPPRSAEPAPDITEWHGRYVLSPNRFQTFEYLDTIFGAIRISGEDELLTMSSLQQSPRQLRALGDYFFSANDRATVSHVFLRGENDEYLISDGFKTYARVSTAFLTAHWASVLLGLAGITWLLVAGFISLLRYRTRVFRQAEAPAFVALLSLVIPVPFFFTRSFMALGDLTVASALLALATLLLPVGMLLTLIRVTKSRGKLNLLHGLAAVLVLQWCAVLIAAGLLPLRLWA